MTINIAQKKHLFNFFLLLIVIILPQITNAQYKLTQAFPDLKPFEVPTELAVPGDGTNRLFIPELKGKIYILDNNSAASSVKTFINLESKVSQTGSELGLLGLAFHPNYENNRYFYTHYILDSAGSPSGYWIRVSRFTASAENPDSADINSERILLTISTPRSYHNGGKIAFGPDGYLYIAIGDGAGTQGEAQNNSLLLGKVLRINVDSASGGRNYSIPSSNPFYNNSEGKKEEIYAFGFRNPWKFSFDNPENRLWIGDVGQSNYEEIDLVEKGKNYGWNKMEGFHCFPNPAICDTNGLNMTLPVFEYTHSGSYAAVTAGFVYRGTLLPELYGKFIFGDYQQGKIWSLNYDGVNPATSTLLLDTTFYITSFGTDENNELYVCTYNQGIFKITNKNVIYLDLHVAMQGFYQGADGSMVISDTATAFLHRAIAPFDIIDSAKTLINKNTLNGHCLFQNALTGNYYISVRHRNCLETWSKTGGEALTKGETVSYDFTNSLSNTYGNNSVFVVNKYCIYSGDVNQDRFINLQDILNIYNDGSDFLTGYLDTDLNGDNNSDLFDLVIAYNNSSKFVSVINP